MRFKIFHCQEVQAEHFQQFWRWDEWFQLTEKARFSEKNNTQINAGDEEN